MAHIRERVLAVLRVPHKTGGSSIAALQVQVQRNAVEDLLVRSLDMRHVSAQKALGRGPRRPHQIRAKARFR